jgi:hypothetical protein
MWALVESGSVTAVYTRPKAITLNGIQHPRSIFTRWSAAELQAIGIYSYSEVNASVDTRFYKQGGSSVVVDDAAGTVTKTYSHVEKALEDSNQQIQSTNADGVAIYLDADGVEVLQTDLVEDVEYTPKMEDYLDEDGEVVTTLGLKSQKKSQVKATAASLLSPSDWYVVRAAEGGAAIPTDVATYRAAVRTASGTMEAAIDAAADMDAFIALHTDIPATQSTNADGVLIYLDADDVEVLATDLVEDVEYTAKMDAAVTATLNDWPTIPDTLA